MQYAYKYTIVPINKLNPFPRNSRTHSDSQIDQIAASIKEFGFTNPVLIDEDKTLIAGHGRILAAHKLNISDIPCIILSGLTPLQKKAYVIADNKLALNAGWDFDNLIFETDELKDNGFDVELTGFTLDELEGLRSESLIDGLTDEDDVPVIPGEPVTKMGDIWILGNHRLMCGDSTNPDDVLGLTLEHKPNLMVTDPPYGVKYDPEWRDSADLGVGERSRGKVENDDRVDWTDAYSLFTGDITYVWHAGLFAGAVATHLSNCGFELVSQIIWVKQHFALSRGDYHWQHEPCWYAVRKGKKHNWNGARDQATTWDILNNNSFGNANPEKTWGHGTQKPIECMARPIQNNSKPNDYIYDPFGGSGTTMIACEKYGRKCLMMEISPQYCDVIIKRWEQFTGKKAILHEA